jgi:hypothetical protein
MSQLKIAARLYQPPQKRDGANKRRSRKLRETVMGFEPMMDAQSHQTIADRFPSTTLGYTVTFFSNLGIH